MNAEIIAIGSELLTPHRSDTNSLFLTGRLNQLGVEVVFKTVVGDDRQRLTETIALAWRRSDLVFTIGGLGPTEDDLTRECASAALGRPLQPDDTLAADLEARFRTRGMAMPAINLRQILVIEGAAVMNNRNGTAPGQWIEERGKILVLLPGPPRELRPMFVEYCLPRLRGRLPSVFIRTRVLRMAGLPESAAEEIAAPIYTRYQNPVTTILASPGEVQLHLRSHAHAEAEAESLLDRLSSELEQALQDFVFSSTGESLEAVTGALLKNKAATLAVAESCTGGLLAQRITSISGSSAYFLGGVVCYSNAAKAEWLDVSVEDLEKHGAVSATIAKALAEGVRRKADSTFGLGITGIAGPEGGTPAKPVGLVYLALAGPDGARVLEKRYLGEREIIRWQAAQTALDLLRRALQPSLSESRPPRATPEARS
ncbi:MAG: competence/damage-inducible protein A [Acidobacteria bacterium]|nr:competence/damage-inducible protein A [Acidobacteriota bacterium]